jgi:hypothetical protein
MPLSERLQPINADRRSAALATSTPELGLFVNVIQFSLKPPKRPLASAPTIVHALQSRARAHFFYCLVDLLGPTHNQGALNQISSRQCLS